MQLVFVAFVLTILSGEDKVTHDDAALEASWMVYQAAPHIKNNSPHKPAVIRNLIHQLIEGPYRHTPIGRFLRLGMTP
jgi:hypothetical protein